MERGDEKLCGAFRRHNDCARLSGRFRKNPLSAAAERILTADCNNDGFYTAPITDIVQTHVAHYISLLAEIQQDEEVQWGK